VTASKRDRQHAILDLIGTREIGSQEDLRLLLLKQGWDVTQSTLSRDLRDLRTQRIPTDDGRYVAASPRRVREPAALLPQLLMRLDGVSHDRP
jgi:transcriptional regulator of arginine metabolism